MERAEVTSVRVEAELSSEELLRAVSQLGLADAGTRTTP